MTEKKFDKKDILKYEIAKELGLNEKISKGGWKSLTSKESGKIGGILNQRLRKEKNHKCE